MLSVFDDEYSEDEDSWITIGKDKNNVALTVIHIFKEIDFDNCTV